MIFFEKITKCIAFARDLRYTVTRIAPATCGFCALLPKQLTPRQGTKTSSILIFNFASWETTYTPSGDENKTGFYPTCYFYEKQLTPRQGTKTNTQTLTMTKKKETTYTPSGDENSKKHRFFQCNVETTYTPSGDENAYLISYLVLQQRKQLTPRQGTKTR